MDSDYEKIKKSLFGENRLCPSDFTRSKLVGFWKNELSGPPLSGRFIAWLIRDKEIDFEGDFSKVLIESCLDPGAFATLANMSSSGELPASSFGINSISALLDVVRDSEKFYGLRGQAILLFCVISIDSPAAFRSLRSYLFSINAEDDSRFLNYVAAAVGLLSSHIELAEAEVHLQLLFNLPEVKEEASIQLGFLYLSNALSSSDRIEALSYFGQAHEKFEISPTSESVRVDAKLLYQCLTILLKFQSGVKSDVAKDIKVLNEAAFDYSSLLIKDEYADRITGSRSEESYRWMLFSTRMSMLYSSLEESTWLEAARVIEEQLLFIYYAQRTIFGRDDSRGISAVVKPVIHKKIQENSFHLSAVKAWLEKNNNRNEDWDELYDIVNVKLESQVFRNPRMESVAPVKVEIQEELSKFTSGKEWIDTQFYESKLAFETQLPSPAIVALREKLGTFLQSCMEVDDILTHKDAKHLFFYLFDRVIAFLKVRISMPSHKNSTTRYLQYDYEGEVKEENLQDDLFEFLQSGTTQTNLSYEPRKHSGGRADIKITYINVNTVIELKKIDKKMTDEEILFSYGPQASTYQVADANFCFLGVLDNYDNNGIQTDLRDCLSCHHWTPKNGVTRYSVIVFRIQGKRRHPSDLSNKIRPQVQPD